ncbi:MAG: hypothetical protein R2851_26005 [Caldilineaceae bacterium]
MSQVPIAVACRRPRPDVAVLDIVGDLTGAAEGALMDAYATAGDGGTRAVVLNFSDLGYSEQLGHRPAGHPAHPRSAASKSCWPWASPSIINRSSNSRASTRRSSPPGRSRRPGRCG